MGLEPIPILMGLILGPIAGSFLAVALIRWPAGASVISGRSHCDGYGRPLQTQDLVPILSYLVLRGRCRACGSAIDPRHLAMEAAGCLVGVTAAVAHPEMVLVTAIFGWWLLLIMALDLQHHWLPDRLTLPLIPAGLAVAAFGIGPMLEDRVIGAATGYAGLAAIALLYRTARGRDGMGGGDPKLMAALGAWLGWQSLPYLMIGAGAVGLAMILFLRRRGVAVGGSYRLPLGTLLALAAWPVWLVAGA
jgi:leader peptidase (prepilin peptidase)/N-methyltransferase